MPCQSCLHTQPTFADYYSSNLYTWCTNCGNYGIHAAVKRALVADQIPPCQAMLCFDIGCNGNGSDKIDGYRFHGLHGRIISFACGVSVANSDLTVMAFAGDGATFGEGIGHLIHAIRGNYHMTLIFHNNFNYGLTQGQASATTRPGMIRTAAPDGITSDPVHPARLVLALGATFVARSFSGDVKHMTEVMRAANQHQGFSFVEILQSCPTYNKETPHEWYQDRSYDVATIPNYNPADRQNAVNTAEDIENHIALGVLYQDHHSVPFHKRQANRLDITTQLIDEVRHFDVTNLKNKLR